MPSLVAAVRRVGFLVLNTTAICLLAILQAAGAQGAQAPRDEHPRPDFRRELWLSLNGPWQFCSDPSDRGLDEQWYALSGPEAAARFDQHIDVPLRAQSAPAAVDRANGRAIGWYRRTLRVPESFGGRHVWLCFGAVDCEAQVWVDGQEAGRHEGGCAPFDLDITRLAEPGREVAIVVRVAEANEPRQRSDEQQQLDSASAIAIRRPVFLESRPALHLAALRLRPLRWAQTWQLEVEFEAVGPDGKAVVELASSDAAVQSRRVPLVVKDGRARQTNVLEIHEPQPWSPENPHLYDLTISLQPADAPDGVPSREYREDRVHTYFGLRTIERAGLPGSKRTAVVLNGRPIYLRGAVATGRIASEAAIAGNDELLRREIELARAAGFNLLRFHGRPAEPRQLYWADLLGILVWQDVPGLRRGKPLTRPQWERAAETLVRRDINHPSVIVWGLFYEDEVLGEDWENDQSTRRWVEQMVQRVKALDPSRLVVDRLASRPAHVAGDLRVWRFGSEELELHRRHLDAVAEAAEGRPGFGCLPGSAAAGAPLVCGEAGLSAQGSSHRDIAFALRHMLTQLRRHEAFQGYVYEALTDGPHDQRGLVSSDLRPKPFGYGAFISQMGPADLQGDDFVGHEGPAVIEAAPGEQFHLPVFVSHYSLRKESPQLVWYVVGVDDLGREVSSPTMQRRVVWEPFGVTFQRPIEVHVPDERPLVGAVCLELRDRTGKRLAANYVNLIVRRELPLEVASSARDDLVGVEVLGPRLVVLRFHPRDFAALRNTPPDWKYSEAGETLVVPGGCEVEYHLALPPVVRNAVPARIMLLAEVATLAPDPRPLVSAPLATGEFGPAQTHTWPGRLGIVLADSQRTCRLPGDPAGARGVLNWQSTDEYCAYGYLVREVFDARNDPRLERHLEGASQLALVLRAEDGRGLRIYGAGSGRYPIAPTLLVETAMDMHVPLGIFQRETAARDSRHKTRAQADAGQ